MPMSTDQTRSRLLPLCVSRCLGGLSIIALLGLSVGCDAVRHVATSLGPEHAIGSAEPMYYPADKPIGDSMDIEVVRLSRRHVRMTNRTAHTLNDLTVYFNQQYGGTVEALPPGKPVEVALAEFVNEHGERFPVGSFLEPDKARVLILADAVIDDRIHKLNVRLEDDWQQP